MLKKLSFWAVLGLFLVMGCNSSVSAEVTVGQPAPNFAVADTNGKMRSLSEFKGKFVVLEWFNPDCPVSKGFYDNQTMQNLQKSLAKKGIVWLSIDSSAPGKQGNITPEKGNAILKERTATPTALLLDPDGKIGRLYGAKTTPHMFIIDSKGTLIYNGAIDDKKTGKNLVQAALDEALAGKPVSISATQPYGCSVKY